MESAQSAAGAIASLPGADGPAEKDMHDGETPEADVSRPRAVPDWLVVMEAVRAEPHQVTQVWYPDPRPALLELPNGSNANVLLGAPAYQVSSGDITEL